MIEMVDKRLCYPAGDSVTGCNWWRLPSSMIMIDDTTDDDKNNNNNYDNNEIVDNVATYEHTVEETLRPDRTPQVRTRG